MKSTGSFYEVLGDNNILFSCRIRGKFRLDDTKENNPIAVGDQVQFELEHNNIGSITKILPRINHIQRQSVKKTSHSQVLAANIDQVLLLATVKHPRTSAGFIDRFLVTAESFRIPQLLVFNKSDLLDDKEKDDLLSLIHVYNSLGIQSHLLSARFDDDIDRISHLLTAKKTLIVGHSGAGKSTLLNRLSPAIQQTVSEISAFSEKGTHTTTFVEMFSLGNDTFIIDTPGVKEWGLVEMNTQEISDYFPEMRELRLFCKFGSRCLHVTEPNCAILDGVVKGVIAASRYKSYLSMITGEDNRK